MVYLVIKMTILKLFLATYTVYRIKKHGIALCSRIGTYHPLIDADVERVDDKTKLIIDCPDKGRYKMKRLDLTMIPEDGGREQFRMISPLEILGLEADYTQKWRGRVDLQSCWSGWNTIFSDVDKESLRRGNAANNSDNDDDGDNSM